MSPLVNEGRASLRSEALRRSVVVARWLRRDGLVLATGLAAALPVIVSTVHAVVVGWLPLGDDAVIAVRSFDVLSMHPPLVGQYSAASQVIGEPVLSPGPLLYWLLALPVRLGDVAPAITMGIVNSCAVVGVVALARRRGGLALMFVTAAVVAGMCGSLDASILHDVWNPAAAVLPFLLLIFLAWSLACGEYRLLPLTALVASFTAQAQLTYVIPDVALLVVGIGFLAWSRPKIPRRWLTATLVIVIVCWSFPLAEEVVHRPGNVERIVQVATTDKPTLGAAAGWHTIVRAVGIPPWWLGEPRAPFARVTEVTYAPTGFATAMAVLLLVTLAGVAGAGLVVRRREVAAAGLLALGLLISLGVVTASTPSGGMLFAVVSYTLWWASPAGMFSWLVVGFGAVALLGRSRRLGMVLRRAMSGGDNTHARSALASAACLVAVAAIGAVVAAGGKPDRLENAFDPAHAIVDGVRAQTPRGGTVLITGSPSEIVTDLKAAIAYGLRSSGIRFVLSDPPGIGTRYDPARRPHDRAMEVIEQPTAGQADSRVIARAVLVNVPSDAPPPERGPRAVVVRLLPAVGASGQR
jgi:hypothetical protein